METTTHPQNQRIIELTGSASAIAKLYVQGLVDDRELMRALNNIRLAFKHIANGNQGSLF